MKELKTDVVIVGGGPAGVSAALILGKNKINVILLDRKSKDQIGNKHCGDALSPVLTEKITKEGIPSPRKEDLCAHVNELYMCSITPGAELKVRNRSATVDRHSYGQFLLEEVEKYETVTVLSECRIMKPIIENGAIVGVEGREKNEAIKIRASVVVDGAGTRSNIRKNIPEDFPVKFDRKTSKVETLTSYREIIETSKASEWQEALYLIYEEEAPMPGYWWIFPKGKDRLNVGLGFLLLPSNKNISTKERCQRIRKKSFPDAKVIDGGGDLIPARLPLRSCVAPGYIAVGDAACLVNPISGEGHGPALWSGIYAARTIIDALQKSDFSEESLWSYNLSIWPIFGVEHSMGVAVIKFLEKGSFEDLDFLFAKKVIESSDVEDILSDQGTLSLMKKAFRGIRRPRLLLRLRKTLKLVNSIQKMSLSYPSSPEEFETWDKKLSKILSK
ncbi:MAG: NAD(P)/FAD-dependent oxidoreductase [Candidatus Kariarchaeaceae archaeon]